MPEAVKGMDQLQRQFKQLEEAAQQAKLIEAAKAGAQIFLDAARALAPRDTGKLADNLMMEVLKSATLHQGLVGAGPNQKQFYGFFLEFGTKRMIEHPFLTPALEANRERIIEAMKNVIFDEIRKVAA